MTENNNTPMEATDQTTPFLVRKIGRTTYTVGIHFNQESKETMDDKILRLMKNDIRSNTSNG